MPKSTTTGDIIQKFQRTIMNDCRLKLIEVNENTDTSELEAILKDYAHSFTIVKTWIGCFKRSRASIQVEEQTSYNLRNYPKKSTKPLLIAD